MLLATALERAFFFKEKGQQVELADPNPDWSPETVLNFYANTYPVLTTAKINGPEITDDKVQYRFESAMGTKG